LETSSGNRVNDLAARLAAAEATILLLQQQLSYIRRNTPPQLPYTVYTFAGTGVNGFSDGAGSEATFSYVTDLCFTHDYSGLYIGDMHNHRLRRMDLEYPYTVTTIATNLNSIWGVASSPDGYYVYASTISGSIGRVEVSTGTHTEMISSGRYRGMTITRDGSTLYVADEGRSNVARIDTATGSMATSKFSPFTCGWITGDWCSLPTRRADDALHGHGLRQHRPD
jgi:DNA-binding beta-propeller fold protein YncE